MKYLYQIQETNNSEKKSENNFKTILSTAIITSFLTVFTQYFLQKSQLSEEQNYWKKRYNIERVQGINDQRLKLIEEISEGILQLEYQAKQIKIQSAVVKYLNDEKQIDEFKELTLKYHKDLYLLASKMEIASIYFDEKVDKNLMKLSEALIQNYQNNYTKNTDSKIQIPEFNQDFETIDKLKEIKKQTFEMMLNNMNEDFNNLNKN